MAEQKSPAKLAPFSGNIECIIKEFLLQPLSHVPKAVRSIVKDLDKIVKNMLADKDTDQSSMNIALQLASKFGRTDVVRMMLRDRRTDPSHCNNYAISLAAEEGHADIVRLLLQDHRTDPFAKDPNEHLFAPSDTRFQVARRPQLSSDFTRAANYAAKNGHVEVLKVFMEDVRFDFYRMFSLAVYSICQSGHMDALRFVLQDPRVSHASAYSHAFSLAVEAGCAKAVTFLLNEKGVIPSPGHAGAIKSAAMSGHTDVMRIILQDGRFDPTVDNNYIIQSASRQGHTEIIRALLRDGRASPAACDPDSVFSRDVRFLLMRSRSFCERISDILDDMDEEETLCLSLCLTSPEDLKPLRSSHYQETVGKYTPSFSSSSSSHYRSSGNAALTYIQHVCSVLDTEGELPNDVCTSLIADYMIGCTDE